MLSNVYSPYKLAYLSKEIDRFCNNEMVYPRKMIIDPVNFCNHNCPFCICRYKRTGDLNANFVESDIIPYEKMASLLFDCVELGIKAVELAGGGEPTLHPDILGILHDIHARGLELGLITNGCGKGWEDTRYEILGELNRAKWVRFSVDASTPETYSLLHATDESDFGIVKENIDTLAYTGTCVVGVSFIITRQNYHEIVSATQMAHDLGADNIRIADAVLWPGYHDQHQATVYKLLAEAKKLETDRFQVYTFSNRTNEGYNEDDQCFISSLQAVVGAYQVLYPCCVLKYRPRGHIVSLHGRSLVDAWHSDEREQYYDNLNLQKCPSCYLKPKNDFLKQVASAGHRNFL